MVLRQHIQTTDQAVAFKREIAAIRKALEDPSANRKTLLKRTEQLERDVDRALLELHKEYLEVEDTMIVSDERGPNGKQFSYYLFVTTVKRHGRGIRRKRSVVALEGKTKRELNRKLEKFVAPANVIIQTAAHH